jgi:membrane protease subunit HflK
MTGMSNDPKNAQPASAATPVDSGSQALAEALRSSFAIVKFVMGALLVLFLVSGIFTVGPQEKAIILRFGRPVGDGDKALLGAGAHWSWPYPIDEVVKVPITGIQKVTSSVGWYATTPEMELAGTEPPPGPSLNPAIDGYALTADGNIVHARATLSYRIEEPIRYVFDFVNASNAVQNALNNALLATAARFNVDDILTRDRIGFQDAVRRRTVQIIEAQKLGIIVEQCPVESRPPRQLKQAFDSVVSAGINRNKVLDEARSQENRTLSAAGADATAIVNIAESDRTRLVQSVAADAERFNGLLAKYESNPDLFMQQQFVQTMSRVLTNVSEKIYLPERADGKSRQLRLLLNREPPKQKTEETKP